GRDVRLVQQTSQARAQGANRGRRLQAALDGGDDCLGRAASEATQWTGIRTQTLALADGRCGEATATGAGGVGSVSEDVRWRCGRGHWPQPGRGGRSCMGPEGEERSG